MPDYLISQELTDGENAIYTPGQGPLDLLGFSLVLLSLYATLYKNY